MNFEQCEYCGEEDILAKMQDGLAVCKQCNEKHYCKQCTKEFRDGDEDWCRDCDGDPICGSCSGSGEGMYDGSRCRTCRGSGVNDGGRYEDEQAMKADYEYDRWKEERYEK